MGKGAKIYYIEDYLKNRKCESIESKVAKGGYKAIDISVVVDKNVWDVKRLLKKRALRKKDLCAIMVALNTSGIGALAFGAYSGQEVAVKMGLVAFSSSLFIYLRDRFNDYQFKGLEKYRKY